MPEYQTIEHTFQPIFDNRSKILILGSLPSVKSKVGTLMFVNDINANAKGYEFLYRLESAGR